MTNEPFDWQPIPRGTNRSWAKMRAVEQRLDARIEADLRYPNRSMLGMGPADRAPLVDIVVEPIDPQYRYPDETFEGLIATRPADGLPGERVIARGTRLHHRSYCPDSYDEGQDLKEYEIADGPEAGTSLWVGYGGRLGLASNLVEDLLARADEPVLSGPDAAGTRLLADLRLIVEEARASITSTGELPYAEHPPHIPRKNPIARAMRRIGRGR
jgi:hypothetical protein